MASAPDAPIDASPERDADAEETLSLYSRPWCGACVVVERTIAQLGLKIEIRDVYAEPGYHAELYAARGRGTVPVLRRDLADGRTEWMGESRDIVRYLVERFAG